MKRGFALLIILAVAACSQKPYGPEPEVGIEGFLTGGPGGGYKSLSDLRGNVVLLEFWATWCGPCIETIPHMNKLVDKFQGRPVRFISVTDEKAATVRAFMADHPMKAWIALDPSERLSEAFHVRGIPRAILIDPYGIMRHITDPRFLDASDIEESLKAKPPPPAEKKS